MADYRTGEVRRRRRRSSSPAASPLALLTVIVAFAILLAAAPEPTRSIWRLRAPEPRAETGPNRPVGPAVST